MTKDPERAGRHPGTVEAATKAAFGMIQTTGPGDSRDKSNLSSPTTPSEISTPFIKLTECEDVFGPSVAHVRTDAELDLGNLLGAFPAPPETTPVWWLHRTPSRSKEKNQLCAWTSRTPPLNTSTPKQTVAHNADPNSGPKVFPKRCSPSPGSKQTPPREDNSLGSDVVLGVSFEAFPSPKVTPRAQSTPVLAKLAYPIACLAANNLPDTSPTLNIRSKSVNGFKGSSEVIQARAQRLPSGHRNV